MKLSSTFAALTVAVGFLTAPLGAAAQQPDNLPARVTEFAVSEAPDDHVVGSEDAALTLIMWASVACSHCATWFTEEWPVVKSELVETGKLRVVFREFRTGGGNLALTGFGLAECAPTEDFMPIIEFQMVEQNKIFEAVENGKGAEAYALIAEMAGMETNEAIASCLRNPDITAHILDNERRAKLAEVTSVPAFLINGQRYKGKSDAKTLISLVNDLEKNGVLTLPEDIDPADAHAGHDHN